MLRDLRKRKATLWLAFVGMMTAMNIILSSFSIPLPWGHLYLNETVIYTAALMLDPLGAFIVGGVGAFFGDLFFYPAAMFVSLFAHGLEALVIALLAAKDENGKKIRFPVAGMLIGSTIMAVLYACGRVFVYGGIGWAAVLVMKTPLDYIQAAVGAAVSFILVYKLHLPHRMENVMKAGI